MEKIKELYWLRFNATEREIKNKLWKVLCASFLQKYINTEDTVLDLGCGSCEFINNIECRRKLAVDVNEDTKKFASSDVKVYITKSSDMRDIQNESIDVVFASELFEHLKNIEELFATFLEIYLVLKKGGKLIIICPNIRFLADRYWDFIDHRLALSHVSLKEGLRLHNYKIQKMVPKFLPYTTKSILPKSAVLLKLYLKFPMLWWLIGKQMFIVAEK